MAHRRHVLPWRSSWDSGRPVLRVVFGYIAAASEWLRDFRESYLQNHLFSPLHGIRYRHFLYIRPYISRR